MEVRRVVTGKTPEGKSVFASDGPIETIAPALTPGAEFHTIWGSDVVTQLPQSGALPAFTQWFPPRRLPVGFFTVAPANTPAAQLSDPGAALARFEAKLPACSATWNPAPPACTPPRRWM